jgi:non-ribosomal peptide synthetase component F
MHRHQPGLQLTIGRSVPNTNVYILDDCENPAPIGETGFMWAGGRCVSRGYVNLSEGTPKRFKVDKFVGDGYEVGFLNLLEAAAKPVTGRPCLILEILVDDERMGHLSI